MNIILKGVDKFFGALLGGIFIVPGFVLALLVYLIPAYSFHLAIKEYQKAKGISDMLVFLFEVMTIFPVLLAIEVICKVLEGCFWAGVLAVSSPFLIFYGIGIGINAGASQLPRLAIGEALEWIRHCIIDEPIKDTQKTADKTQNPEVVYQKQFSEIKTNFPEKLRDAEIKNLQEEYNALICPIKLELPKDPIRLKCCKFDNTIYLAAQPYERKEILAAIKKGYTDNPLTREPIVAIVDAPDIKKRILTLCNTIKNSVKTFFAKKDKANIKTPEIIVNKEAINSTNHHRSENQTTKLTTDNRYRFYHHPTVQSANASHASTTNTHHDDFDRSTTSYITRSL